MHTVMRCASCVRLVRSVDVQVRWLLNRAARQSSLSLAFSETTLVSRCHDVTMSRLTSGVFAASPSASRPWKQRRCVSMRVYLNGSMALWLYSCCYFSMFFVCPCHGDCIRFFRFARSDMKTYENENEKYSVYFSIFSLSQCQTDK